MKFRSLILVLTLTFTGIFITALGSSYAYYVSSNGVHINLQTDNFNPNLAVVFNESQYINMTNASPIPAASVNEFASKNTFSISPNKSILNGAEVAVNILLTNIVISNELKTSDFKYRLECNGSVLSTGDGSNFTTEAIQNGLKIGSLSTSNGTFNINNNYNFTLRVWIEDTGANQNNLMNKNFSAYIKVNTLFKK